MELKKK